MGRKRRSIQKNELVIVCEGSDTEYNYFCEIQDLIGSGHFTSPYTRIKILPGQTDDITPPNGRKNKYQNGNADELRYYELEDVDEPTYNQYSSQPLRYLREAELFLIHEDYDEAWAVYDWDEKPGMPRQKKHEDAQPIINRNKGKLFVAFSSYSFEQWLLCHFEHNATQFANSDCSASKKKSYMCGSAEADPKNDCHGEKCIAGYIRSKGYIPLFKKSDTSLFSTYTEVAGKVKHEALFNAAWLRFKGKRFSEDAYTDVDRLVCKLISDDSECMWMPYGDVIGLRGTQITFDHSGDNFIIVNTGTMAYVIPPASIYVLDKDGNRVSEIVPPSRLIDLQKPIVLQIDLNGGYLSFVDGHKEYVFDN